MSIADDFASEHGDGVRERPAPVEGDADPVVEVRVCCDAIALCLHDSIMPAISTPCRSAASFGPQDLFPTLCWCQRHGALFRIGGGVVFWLLAVLDRVEGEEFRVAPGFMTVKECL